MTAQPNLFAPAAAPAAPAADDDADVRAAIVAFAPSVIRIRELSAQAHGLQPGRDRTAVEEEIQSLVADIATRAERLSLTLDDMFRLINAELATKRTATAAPHGDYLRHLLDTNTAAYGDHDQVAREAQRLAVNLKRAEERCTEADRACAGFVAGWARRGGGR